MRPMTRRFSARLSVILALLVPTAAQAQAYQCAAPARFSMPAAPRQDGPTRRIPIARYVLAASWSPEHCKARGRDPANSLQCSGRNGRFGFILHGLWPEAARGPWPQWCALTPRPSPQTLRTNLCMSPSPRLLEHAWAKHGSCMAQRPEGYFKVAAVLWNALRWPDLDRLSRQPGLTAGDLRREFVRANPDWPRSAVGVDTNRAGWLRELRLCYDRKFMPEPCPRGSWGPADGSDLKIWRGL